VGYGKEGSFEGFCSGGGIARLGEILARRSTEAPSYVTDGSPITARAIADAARAGDPTAKEVFRISAEKLGEGLSILIDLFNPEAIVIGSIFARCTDLLYDGAMRVIEREALAASRGVFKLLPAALGESIGDYGAVATALL
jgi:glucokinase